MSRFASMPSKGRNEHVGPLPVLALLMLAHAGAFATAQSITITDATPSPVVAGKTLTVTVSMSAGASGSPSGCLLTLIPYGQGNVASFISEAVTRTEVEITLPTTLAPGPYDLVITCDSIAEGKTSSGAPITKWVGATRNVTVSAPVTFNTIAPAPASLSQTISVAGWGFGASQGSSYVHLIGSGVPDVYITHATSWSNTLVSFSLPEYTAAGYYSVQVETPYGASNIRSGFEIHPSFTGWVDLHTHPMSYLGFGGKLIYGAVDIGSELPPESPPPTFSCVHNIVANTEQEALGQENLVHGGWGTDNPCGDSIRSLVIQALEAAAPGSAAYSDSTYKTSGFQGPNPNPPDFSTWPAWNDLVDQRMWINWIRRAYDGGQRVLVALAVNNKLLGDITRGPNDLPDDDKASGDLQIAQIQAFVARHSDFMQIAQSSSDIQSIVSQNKLAVVVGVELDDIGNYGAVQPHRPVTATAGELTAEVDRLFDEGVRYIFPIHLVDNAIGGSAVYNPLFDYANEWEAGSAYAIACSQPSDDVGFALNTAQPGVLKIASESISEGPILEQAKLGKVLPTPPLRTCPAGTGNVNAKGLSDSGIAAIKEMMNKNMLIDIDHMSQLSANATIALAQQHKPYPYPLFSGHNGVRATGGSERSLTAGQYTEIGKLHGMAGVGSAKLDSGEWLAMFNHVTQAMGQGSGAGFGTDMDGMEFAMPQRIASGIPTVQYGSGTMPNCSAVTLLPISTEGNKSWNYNDVGVAHYGMLPDFLQDVALQPGGCTAVTNMNSGAQYFYETWRIVEGNASAIAPPAPAIPKAAATPSCPGIQIPNSPSTGNDTDWMGAACTCPASMTVTPYGACACASGKTFNTQTGTCVAP